MYFSGTIMIDTIMLGSVHKYLGGGAGQNEGGPKKFWVAERGGPKSFQQ